MNNRYSDDLRHLVGVQPLNSLLKGRKSLSRRFQEDHGFLVPDHLSLPPIGGVNCGNHGRTSGLMSPHRLFCNSDSFFLTGSGNHHK